MSRQSNVARLRTGRDNKVQSTRSQQVKIEVSDGQRDYCFVKT
jgi:hypothetical protein